MTNLEDRQAIVDIIARERAARDAADWKELARCYTADSLVDLSWFRGTGASFAEASAGMALTMLSFHEVGTPLIELNGDRALGDTGCTIHLIGELDGVEVDVLGYNRLRARVQRAECGWRMAGLRTVYIHDLIIPLNPSCPPRVAREDLEKYRRSYRCLSHMLVNHGLPARDDLPGVDKPETVAMLVAAEKVWLHDGSTA